MPLVTLHNLYNVLLILTNFIVSDSVCCAASNQQTIMDRGVVAIEGVDPKLDIFSIKQILLVDNCTQFGEFDPLTAVPFSHQYDNNE